MKKILFILIFFFLIGCDPRLEMREFFKKPKVLTDTQGREYFVEHYFGGNYTVIPLPK